MNIAEAVKQTLTEITQAENWNDEQLKTYREDLLKKLINHAYNTSPHFKQRLEAANLKPEDISTIDNLQRLPVLTRRDLQTNIQNIISNNIPSDHLPTGEVKTSGSSGEPVKLLRTKLNQIYWLAHVMREHLWNKRNFSGISVSIRANLPGGEPVSLPDWGNPANLLYKTGPAYAMPINRNISEQAAWLQNINPDYLLIYPNNLTALLDELARKKIKLSNLKQVRSIGETLSEQLRQRTEQELNVKIADSYSSQELGYIAIQNPDTGFYSIMENLIVEILDNNNIPCAEGEIGRVVVTDLNNYATPLFRYDIGDYAEKGYGNTLKRIIGRERNMLIVNGERRWPLVGFHKYRDIAPIEQYQIIQKTNDLLEVKLIATTPLNQTQEQALTELINSSLGHEFKINFIYYEGQIPRPASGKFEEFVCEIKG